MLGCHFYFDIRHNQDGRVISCTRLLPFTPQGNSVVLISVGGCVDPSTNECDLSVRSREIFKGPHGKWNPEPPGSWRSASTNCVTSCQRLL